MGIFYHTKYYFEGKLFRLHPCLTYLQLFIFFLVFALIPNISIPEFAQPFYSEKTFLFLFLLSISLPLSVLIYVFNPNDRIQITKIDIWLMFLLLYVYLNQFLIHKDYTYGLRSEELLGLEVLYVCFRLFPSQHYESLLIIIFIAGVIAPVRAITAVFTDRQPIGGNFINIGQYGGYIMATGVFALLINFSRKIIFFSLQSVWKLDILQFAKVGESLLTNILFVGTILPVVLLPATRSRASCLTFFLFFLILNHKRIRGALSYLKQRMNSAIVLLTTGATLLAIILFMVFIYKMKQDSAEGRIMIWSISKNLFSSNMLFGLGFDRFDAYYMNAQSAYVRTHPTITHSYLLDNTRYAFCEPVQLILEEGIIGTILLFGSVWAFLTTSVEKKFEYLKGISIGMLGCIISFGLFTYFNTNLPLKIFICFSIALLSNSCIKEKGVINIGRRRPLKYKAWTIFLFIVLSVGFAKSLLLNRAIRIRRYYTEWQNGMELYMQSRYKESIIVFSEASTFFERNGDFLMNYGKALQMANDHPQAIRILKQSQRFLNSTVTEIALGISLENQQMFQESEKAYFKASTMAPCIFYPHLLLVKQYLNVHRYNDAFREANIIINKPIKFNSSAIIRMKRDMRELIKSQKFQE